MEAKVISLKPTLSIIIPTCGRDSLLNTLISINRQALEPGDEVIVVGDGHQPVGQKYATCSWKFPVRYLIHGPTRNFGNSQREFAQQLAHGSHIAFMDDDDIFTEEAFIKIRKAIVKAPTFPHIFKVVSPWRETVWTEEGLIEQGNVCTIQVVVPNVREKLPAWPKRQGGNIPWTRELRGAFGPHIWRNEIIAICRPYEEDIWWT